MEFSVTTRKIHAGRYAVCLDGAETTLTVERSHLQPHWQQKQEWSLFDRNSLLMTADSKGRIVFNLCLLFNVFSKTEKPRQREP